MQLSELPQLQAFSESCVIPYLSPPRRGLVSSEEVVHNVAHVHFCVVERMPWRLCQEMQGTRDLFHQHESRQSAASRFCNSCHTPAERESSIAIELLQNTWPLAVSKDCVESLIKVKGQ